MPLTTTVVGSFPKPDYVKSPDWFRSDQAKYIPNEFNEYMMKANSTGRWTGIIRVFP